MSSRMEGRTIRSVMLCRRLRSVWWRCERDKMMAGFWSRRWRIMSVCSWCALAHGIYSFFLILERFSGDEERWGVCSWIWYDQARSQTRHHITHASSTTGFLFNKSDSLLQPEREHSGSDFSNTPVPDVLHLLWAVRSGSSLHKLATTIQDYPTPFVEFGKNFFTFCT